MKTETGIKLIIAAGLSMWGFIISVVTMYFALGVYKGE